MAEKTDGSILAGMMWMFILSLLLFWLPVVGPIIAGALGGRAAGGVGAGILAVFLPGLFIGVALFLLATSLTSVPLLGAVAGLGGLVLASLHVGPLLLGAVIGGLIA